MKYKIKVFGIWEVGQRKDAFGNEHQEDSTFPTKDELSDNDRTFIVCDGMGGHDAGEVASSTVCEAMGNQILNNGHDRDGIFTDTDLSNAISAAFDAIDKKDTGAVKKMGTTMTFLKLHNAGATIAHMGDSRVYHIRPGKDGENTHILFQTEDHSLLNDLIKAGELSGDEIKNFKQKNVITRAMQPNMERRPEACVYHTSDIKAGDFFYMCTDGMLEDADMDNGMSLRNIFSEEGDPDERRVRILTDVTDNNRDNHTAFIIHIIEVTGTSGGKSDRTATDHSKRIGIVEEDPLQTPRLSEKNADNDEIPLFSGEDSITEASSIDWNIHRTRQNADAKKRKVSRILIYAIIAIAVALFCILSWIYISSKVKQNHNNDKTESIENTSSNKELIHSESEGGDKTEPTLESDNSDVDGEDAPELPDESDAGDEVGAEGGPGDEERGAGERGQEAAVEL